MKVKYGKNYRIRIRQDNLNRKWCLASCRSIYIGSLTHYRLLKSGTKVISYCFSCTNIRKLARQAEIYCFYVQTESAPILSMVLFHFLIYIYTVQFTENLSLRIVFVFNEDLTWLVSKVILLHSSTPKPLSSYIYNMLLALT